MSEQTTAMQVLEKEESTLQLVLMSANRGMLENEAKQRIQQELINFQEHCMYNESLLKCDLQSLKFGIRKVISANLSLDKAKGHVYLLPTSVKDSKDNWKQMLEVKWTSEGLLTMHYNAGSIIDHKRPIVTYDQANKVIGVKFEFQVPTKRWETVEYNTAHFAKWRKASHVKNGRNKKDADLNKLNYANDNYTSFNGGIDPEFASSKAISHGLGKRGLDGNKSLQYQPQPIPVVTQQAEAEHEVIDVEAENIEIDNSQIDFNA
jgi:hypothetical protein